MITESRHIDGAGKGAIVQRNTPSGNDATVLAQADENYTTQDSADGLGPGDLLIAPATVVAYSLSLKKWGLVEVQRCRPIEWRTDVYKKLQMDEGQKEVVRNVIESHHSTSSVFDDFIPGKGRGLVFLLFGPPGCGKTMTAGEPRI